MFDSGSSGRGEYLARFDNIYVFIATAILIGSYLYYWFRPKLKVLDVMVNVAPAKDELITYKSKVRVTLVNCTRRTLNIDEMKWGDGPHVPGNPPWYTFQLVTPGGIWQNGHWNKDGYRAVAVGGSSFQSIRLCPNRDE